MSGKTYKEQIEIDLEIKLRERLQELPVFSAAYFRSIKGKTSARTRLAYAYDLCVFFRYLHDETGLAKGKEITQYTVSILDKVTRSIMEDYRDYLYVYSSKDETKRTNTDVGISRKIASIRSFYKYFFQKEDIKTNPAEFLSFPKLPQKNIIRLDSEEVSELLNTAETGASLTPSQQKRHSKSKVRDTAILTLLLGTGLRVSECIGLDLQDIDFKNHGLNVVRKGGDEVTVYFGDEVEAALLSYLDERKEIVPLTGHENAFFLSNQKRRITTRAVENMVKKYAGTVTTLKNITPHKLRSTYGTQLYRESGDIYLVASILGHSDVNTTRKHYAAMDEDMRKNARNMVNLKKIK